LKNIDTVQVVLSDMHTGSNFALFIGREWHGIKTSHIPRARQIAIRAHWLKFCEAVKQTRFRAALRVRCQ